MGNYPGWTIEEQRERFGLPALGPGEGPRPYHQPPPTPTPRPPFPASEFNRIASAWEARYRHDKREVIEAAVTKAFPFCEHFSAWLVLMLLIVEWVLVLA